MANLRGSTGGSLGGGIINTRARGPVLEKNTGTCPVCWSGKGYPCQTKSGDDMRLTHLSLRAGKTEPPKARSGKRSAPKKQAPAKQAKTRGASAGKQPGPTVEQLPGGKSWNDDFPDTWGGTA